MNEILIDPTDLLRVFSNRKCRQLRVAAANRVETYLAGLNGQLRNLDRLGDVVQPFERTPGTNWRIACLNGQRPDVERSSVDVCDLEDRETVRATLSRDELREWQKRNSPMDGPRARTEVPFAGNYS